MDKTLVVKWKKTGLLDKLDESDQIKLAIILERHIHWLKLRKRDTRVDAIILPIARRLFDADITLEPKHLYDYISKNIKKVVLDDEEWKVCFGSYTNLDAEAEFCAIISDAIINGEEPEFPERLKIE